MLYAFDERSPGRGGDEQDRSGGGLAVADGDEAVTQTSRRDRSVRHGAGRPSVGQGLAERVDTVTSGAAPMLPERTTF